MMRWVNHSDIEVGAIFTVRVGREILASTMGCPFIIEPGQALIVTNKNFRDSPIVTALLDSGEVLFVTCFSIVKHCWTFE